MSIASGRPAPAGTGDGPGNAPRGYRRRVIGSASVALAMTAPGQTAAVSVFVDPLIASLEVPRWSVATAYAIGSLAGAPAMPWLGRMLDRFGPRRVMAVIGCCFGAILLAAAAVTEIVGLTAAFVGIRIGGQGALSLVATTAVAVYVQRRRGLATGVVTAVGTSVISLAPLGLEHLINDLGWRTVWQLQGWAVLALTVPAALLVLPRRVRTGGDLAVGTGPPGDVTPSGPEPGTPAGAGSSAADRTLRQAGRTSVFWIVIAGTGVCSLVTTALTFHQVSLLGERGLSVAEAAANFVPQLFAGLSVSFLFGWLADYVGDRALIVAVMVMLALATVGAGCVRPGWTAVVYGLALGACIGGIRTLKGVVFNEGFGSGHLATLRGTVHAVIIGTSAPGPLVLALGRAWSSSYQPTLLVLCLLPALVVAAVYLTRPVRPASRRQTAPRSAGPMGSAPRPRWVDTARTSVTGRGPSTASQRHRAAWVNPGRSVRPCWSALRDRSPPEHRIRRTVARFGTRRQRKRSYPEWSLLNDE
ncbi:MFS-type transporter involved in bile tolerance, Atg22 family [Pseudonocardia ammonioxydans]|uniref:MFS-type transporter involved in bile tolerance, Atg22 family n=2 Tax=Pseudonocardia ammonioxydans TaxID=260086 RepID=A0A1I5I5Z0_PSUAM|nr:MFS-type transporter involved in bile tolerance, Atg22 family [Pseudonocardia ammonioxydans]